MTDLVDLDVADLALLADLFEYPDRGFSARAARIAAEARMPALHLHLEAFAAEIAALAPELIEEAHVRTFLVAPASAPYVGIHLFGEESFKRAHLMSRLIERFRALGFDPGNELPDHLGVLLRFARHLDAEEQSDLVRWCLTLPVTAMHRELALTRNPYRHLLAAIVAAIAPDGVPENVRAGITITAQAPSPAGCNGCSVQHGGDEL